MTYTPGPWKATALDGRIEITGDEGMVVARIPCERYFDEMQANAKLIEAAPEMVAALEELVDEWRNPERVPGVIPLEVWKNALRALQLAGSSRRYHVVATEVGRLVYDAATGTLTRTEDDDPV